MPTITVTWDVSNEESAVFQQIVTAINARAAEDYARRAAAAAAMDPPQDPGPAPVAETAVQLAGRLGLKSLRAEIVRLRAEIDRDNLVAVQRRLLDPALPIASLDAALDTLGLQRTGLRIAPK